MRYVIGVDVGTQSTKCLLVGVDGKVHAHSSVAYRPETPKPLWAQQDCAVWFDAVCESVRACVAQSGIAPSDIAAMCVSSLYGGAGIPVDDAMRPLHPCLIWMDRRATAEVDAVNATIDVARLEAITGNGVDSYYGFTKMLWIREHLPEVWSKTRYFLPPNSFINWRLTGELAVDHSSAGNIGGVYDAAQRGWSHEALDMLGIPVRMMPPRLVESSDVVGGLSAEWAAKLGLAEGMPLMAGGVDAAVATLCAGVTGSGDHVAMIGTSMCWGFVSPTVDARHKLITMPHVYRGADRSYVFGGAIAAGAAVTWFRDTFCQAEVAEAARTGEDAHALIEREAIEVPPGAQGLVFLPYLMGERSPIWDAQAKGAFIGLSLAHSRAHLYRAVLEGVSFALQHNIEAGRQSGQPLDDRLIVVGGAAHSDLWMQIAADITGYPVFTIEEEVEAALGAAMLAALGAGLIDAAMAESGWVTLVERARPEPAAQAVYRERFDIYKSLYPVLRDAMHRLK
jgi:sugar (pentulose or hexulose) kinase